MEKLVYTIDATGRTLGRVASDAAQALQGKKSVHFARNIVLPVGVNIVNAKKLYLSDRRIKGTSYKRYSGYPGGQTVTSMREMLDKKGIKEVMRITVDGMIPRNKLRKERMKRLNISE